MSPPQYIHLKDYRIPSELKGPDISLLPITLPTACQSSEPSSVDHVDNWRHRAGTTITPTSRLPTPSHAYHVPSERLKLSAQTGETVGTPSEGGWEWAMAEKERLWITAEGTQEYRHQNAITILFNIDDTGTKLSCGLAFPTGPNADCVDWSDSSVRTAAFAEAGAAIDILNPKVCLLQRAKIKTSGPRGSDGNWFHRASDALTAQLEIPELKIGGKSFGHAYSESKNLSDIPIGSHWSDFRSLCVLTKRMNTKFTEKQTEALYDAIQTANQLLELDVTSGTAQTGGERLCDGTGTT